MARQPWHSPNWGGDRTNGKGTVGNKSKTGQTGSPAKRDIWNRAIVEATLNSEEEHPFDIIKQAYLDKDMPLAQRAYFAEKALPYCMPKPAPQKAKENDPLANMTVAEKRKALEDALRRLEAHDVQASAALQAAKSKD